MADGADGPDPPADRGDDAPADVDGSSTQSRLSSLADAGRSRVTGFIFGEDRAAGDGQRAAAPGPTHPQVADEVVADLIDHFDSVEGAWIDRPSDRFLRERWFDFEMPAGEKPVEWYWVNKPNAFVTVLADPESLSTHYHISEPVLDEEETYIRDDMDLLVGDVISIYGDESRPIEERVREFLVDRVPVLPEGSLHKIAYHLLRDYEGYGRLDPLMRDDEIEDISCDGHDIPVFVYHAEYRDLPTNLSFDPDELDAMIRKLALRGDSQISFSNPIRSVTLPRGDRAQLMLGADISTRGSNFTVRRFRMTPFSPVELAATNTFSVEEMAYLWLCIQHRKSVIFVGPTASGKTTSMNAVSLFIHPYSKVVTIEETRELTVPHDNWVAGVARQTSAGDQRREVSLYDLLSAALHQRPEYILIGEIRSDPAVLETFLQSIFTGHAGYTTFHAHDVDEAIKRFRSEPFTIAEPMMASVDIMAVQRMVSVGDGRARRNIRISELTQDESGQAVGRELFRWDPSTDSHGASGAVLDSLVLAEIAAENGWGESRIRQELTDRRRVLQYLLDSGHTSYRAVWSTLYAFMRDRSVVLSAIEADQLDPSELVITNYGEVRTVPHE